MSIGAGYKPGETENTEREKRESRVKATFEVFIDESTGQER
jgi:hypothetical protein